jgi:serine/threonine protein kinase
MPRAVRYRVLRKIAHGGMAEIFLALQTGAEGFQKAVVLKRILPAFAADPHFVRMLIDEAHIASSLSHSHLVQVLDLGKAGGQFFLVLEFVDGWSLEQVRRRAQKARIKFPLPLALNIVASLCRALSYVHRRTRDGKPLGIVHRDVSPQNVLLGREGEVKLADFGIAKAVGRREKSATGIIKGKFAYMSPEQSIGSALDARSDLFSVGTLLYILTTGRKPFDAPTDLEVLMQVRRARYEKPSELVRDFNPDVEKFIARALRGDRARRWQSAEQMADRLDAILVKLGQPGGPAGLKRWLDALSARDGERPPGDLGVDVTDASAGTIELETDDLELRHESHESSHESSHEASDEASVEASVELAPSLPRAVNAGEPLASPSLSQSPSGVAYASLSVRRADLVAVPNPPPQSHAIITGTSAGTVTDLGAATEPDVSPRPVSAPHLVLGVPEFADPDSDDDEDLLSIEIPIFEEEPISAPPAPIDAAVAAAPVPVPAPAAPAPAAPANRIRGRRRWPRRLAGTLVFVSVFSLVMAGALVAGSYLAPQFMPRLPPWVATRLIQPADVWLRRLPERLYPHAPPTPVPATPAPIARTATP